MNLNIPVIASYTDENIETGINEALLAVDMAWRKDTALDLSAGNAAPAAAVAQRTMLWLLQGVATSGRTVTLPAVAKPYLVHLPASATNSVDIIKGTTTITHPVGAMLWYYSGAGANDLIAVPIAGGGVESVTASDFVGCIVSMDVADIAVTFQTTTPVIWRAKIKDTHGFHENVTNPTRFTIPAGVTHVNFRITVAFASSLNNISQRFYLRKNGGAEPGEVFYSPGVQGAALLAATFETGPINCTTSDYFEVVVYTNQTSGSHNLDWQVSRCEMEVVGGALLEGAYNAIPVDVKMKYVAATPAVSTTIFKRMLTHPATFPANFAGSLAACDTNPSGTTTLDVKDNGTTIGTIAFSTAGVVTFATSGGTAKTVAAGHRIEIVTQGSVNGIAGLSATLKGFAS